MTRNVRLANQVVLGVVVVLGITGLALVWGNYVTDSTSIPLRLAIQTVFILMFVAMFVQSVIRGDNARFPYSKYILVAAIGVMLIALVLFIVDHV